MWINLFMPDSFVDARAAAERLKVSRATLYAYVSRGLIGTRPHPEDPRARLYASADIDGLVRRKTLQHRPAEAAATTLDWGLPALETAISGIEAGQLTYRGVAAIGLAQTATLEEVAERLWQSDALERTRFKPGSVPLWAATLAGLGETGGLMRAMALLPLLASGDPLGDAETRLTARGAVLVRALIEAVVPGLAKGMPAHEAIAASWARPAAAEAIRRALVLIADHEMNASTFAVRVIASTGAGLTACLCGGLAALSGPRHGGATARVAAFVDAAEKDGDPGTTIRARLMRGEELPGFGHKLYPEGDPRARALLAAIDAPREQALIAATAAEAGLHPNIDMALVALERAMALPKGAALDLFTIGRSVGWIAHAIEQRLGGQLIRPRARFRASA